MANAIAAFEALGQTKAQLKPAGEIAQSNDPTQIDLEVARRIIDLLELIQHKTRGNLTEVERSCLETTLYQLRMLYVTTHSQMAPSVNLPR